jgi:hypothetical protein
MELLLDLPIIWMVVVVFGATYLFAAALYALITALATAERARALKAISQLCCRRWPLSSPCSWDF